MAAKSLTEKPEPAHPARRRRDLPWKTPKPGRDDPGAPGLADAIPQSPEYHQADHDVAFLRHDETRGVRLQLDYHKAERMPSDHGIAQSIVVLGSTRIPEPAAARQFGTMDQPFGTPTPIQTRKNPPVPGIPVGRSHRERAPDPDFPVDESVVDRRYRRAGRAFA